jgi:large subunit ribosomal protein L29
MAIEKLKDLQSLSDTDLQADLQALQLSYQKLIFEHNVKGLEDPLDLRVMRRNIARVNTEIRKREIGGMSEAALAQRSKTRERRRNRK